MRNNGLHSLLSVNESTGHFWVRVETIKVHYAYGDRTRDDLKVTSFVFPARFREFTVRRSALALVLAVLSLHSQDC